MINPNGCWTAIAHEAGSLPGNGPVRPMLAMDHAAVPLPASDVSCQAPAEQSTHPIALWSYGLAAPQPASPEPTRPAKSP